MPTPLEILQSTFGYTSFRHNQEEAITTVLSGRDSFVLMPTGGGKSLCYQIPALMMPGLTVVVSPLIALMKDQVDALRLSGISAAYLNSTLSPEERAQVMNDLAQKKLKLLYVAPERLIGYGEQFMAQLKRYNVSLFAIDEAHCISQWGHDFRPEYGALAALKKSFPQVPILALTATADNHTRSDIIERLNLRDPALFISSFNRPNISYTIEPKTKPYNRLFECLERHKNDTGIIYVLSRASAEDWAQKLELQGFSAKPYHAGLDFEIRKQNQEAFVRDDVKIIVATTAFGMGINKSNVRFVIHLDLPKNIESYYQETGRAGRDGLQSEALLLYSAGDAAKLRRFAFQGADQEHSYALIEKLEKMVELCERTVCRRQLILNYFGEQAPESCASCDVCLTTYTYEDGTVYAQKALSAVARLGGKFGLGYLIDFLRGSKSERIFEEHKKLPTYGVGSRTDKDEWRRYFRELIAQGYLRQLPGEHTHIALTKKSVPVLSGQEKLQFVARRAKQRVESDTALCEEALFAQLKQLRLEIAREENVPAYIVFSDATLLALATYLPQSLEDLPSISGFGSAKIERYGERFLATVVSYCQEHGLTARPRESQPRSTVFFKTAAPNATQGISFSLFNQGKTIAEIAAQRELSVSTIEGHLAQFVATGELVLERLVVPEKIAAIKAAIREHGDAAVSPLKAVLGDAISYGEIRAVIAAVRREK